MKLWNFLTNPTYRECVEKLELLKAPEERERRLHEIPVVHFDPKMNPHYESDDTEEYFNKEHGLFSSLFEFALFLPSVLNNPWCY